MQSEISHRLISILMKQNFEDTYERLCHSVDDGMALPASIESTAAMLTGGVGHIIIAWVKSGKKKPVDELLADVSALIQRVQSQN